MIISMHKSYEKACIYDDDDGIDVHEVEIDDTTMLPKSVIPVDSYRLVVELGNIIKQLKMDVKSVDFL